MAKKDAIEQIEIEAPYELPEGWRWKTLGNTCDMYQPKTISTKELIDVWKISCIWSKWCYRIL